jgi:hypothetical protein
MVVRAAASTLVTHSSDRECDRTCIFLWSCPGMLSRARPRSSPPPIPPARYRDRGQDPPWTRDHRASPRRPEALDFGVPAIEGLHRNRRLAGPGRDGATSLEGSGHDRSSHREGDDRHDPPQVDHRQDATSARRSTIYLPTAGPWLERLGVRRRDRRRTDSATPRLSAFCILPFKFGGGKIGEKGECNSRL